MGKFAPRSWHMSTILAFAIALVCTISSGALPAFAASLIKISSDPYTNPTSQHKTEVEPDTFGFGSTIVSAFQAGRFPDAFGGSSNIGWATSTDRGNTWKYGFLPSSTVFATPAGTYARASDASVAYDAKYNVWLISWLGIREGSATSPVDVLVSRSTDGGQTFGTPVVVNASGDFNDKNWTVCDNTASSPFYGNCYTEFDDFTRLNRVQMSTSTDGGLTWGAAKTTPDKACVIGGQPLVQPDGTVIVPIDDCFETAILSFRSTDGGKTWSRAVLAAQILADIDPDNIRSGPLPSAEIDKSGKVYVVWEDCRFEAFCTAGNNDLLMITSTDGIHWTLPRRIPIDPIGSGVDHLIPGLAVDQATSGSSAHLGLAYYYFPTVNCTFTTCQLNVGFISSTNGGKSWSKPEHLAGPMSLTWLPNSDLGRMVGDYISTSILPGDDNAFPVFAVALAPTGGAVCGLGVICNQAMYTMPSELVHIAGGTNTSVGDPTIASPKLSGIKASSVASQPRLV
jgi:hypothetical protein